MKNKIAFILEDGRVGGPHIYLLRLLPLLEKNYSCTFIFPLRDSDDLFKKCSSNGIHCISLNIQRMTRVPLLFFAYLLNFPLDIYRIWREIKVNKFDLIYVAGGAWQFKGVLAGKLAGVRVVWHLNDSYLPFYLRVVFSFLAPAAKYFVCASNRTLNYYKRLIPVGAKTLVIPSPLDEKFFSKLADVRPATYHRSSNSDQVHIGTLCNISPVKGVRALIEAADYVSKVRPNFKFSIAGPVFDSQMGYYRNLLEDIKQRGLENIEFIGKVEDVVQYLNSLDIYVCSSLSESSPLAVWEAMACGLPIVTTDVGDVSYYIQNDKNGYVTRVNDSKAIAMYIVNLGDSPKLRKIFGGISKITSEKKLRAGRCAESHVELFNYIFSESDGI